MSLLHRKNKCRTCIVVKLMKDEIEDLRRKIRILLHGDEKLLKIDKK